MGSPLCRLAVLVSQQPDAGASTVPGTKNTGMESDKHQPLSA